MIDPAPKQPENRMHLFDPVGLINDKYAQYGVRPRRATSSNNSFAGTSSSNAGASGGGLRFGVEIKHKAAESDSGGSSPRLWKSSSRHSPPTSPRFGGSPQQQVQNNSHQYHPDPMSPNSRTQAIARGRRELMEMIKDIPESCYELSLRDIVDHKPLKPPSSSPPSPPPPQSPPAATVAQPQQQESKKGEVVEKKFPQQEVAETPKEKKGKEKQKKKGSKKVGKSESKKKMMKNRSVDNGGFLLKTSVFPNPFRSKKKKRSLNQAPSFKVAPKSPLRGPTKPADKHWWVRKSRVSSDTYTGGSATSSSTNSRHKQNPRFLPSCCSFFNDKKMIKANK